MKPMLNAVLVIVCCTTMGTMRSQAQTTYKDVAYASVSSAQKMDIYIPATGQAAYPLIVWIHGGAFMLGDKAASPDVGVITKIVAKGIAVASINYRFSQAAIYPAQINDCKAAVRFLRANAAKYKIDADRIGSWGGSAGGCLSALLGTTSGVTELEGAELGNAGFSSKVIVSVDWYGPIEFLTMDAQATAQGFTLNTNAATSPESRLIGAAIQTVTEKTNKANAMAYVTADDAAFYIQHGTADKNIPLKQSENLYAAVAAAKGPSHAVYESLAGAAHADAAFETDANVSKVITFVSKYLFAQTGVGQGATIPSQFKLNQNFPNPFNPSSTIGYSLSRDGFVSLKVYDLLGREVATLVNEVKTAGSYETRVDGGSLASGAYHYRLQSDGNSIVRSFLLVK